MDSDNTTHYLIFQRTCIVQRQGHKLLFFRQMMGHQSQNFGVCLNLDQEDWLSEIEVLCLGHEYRQPKKLAKWPESQFYQCLFFRRVFSMLQ